MFAKTYFFGTFWSKFSKMRPRLKKWETLPRVLSYMSQRDIKAISALLIQSLFLYPVQRCFYKQTEKKQKKQKKTFIKKKKKCHFLRNILVKPDIGNKFSDSYQFQKIIPLCTSQYSLKVMALSIFQNFWVDTSLNLPIHFACLQEVKLFHPFKPTTLNLWPVSSTAAPFTKN